eukprot:TRINITY_DN73662_c0_g1_i1.p1 TRINITY_DN73662_c0_g1~~TRINITY_DN73662_c0_g1_i1.p1  ORF type:complete len:671 (-),score=137.33 TRINITY_DN73662_c0_g1_i1:213-2159(-)
MANQQAAPAAALTPEARRTSRVSLRGEEVFHIADQAANPAFQATQRSLSIAKSVSQMGIVRWNQQYELAHLSKILDVACQATTVEAAVEEVKSLMALGHNIWAYAYLRALSNKNVDLYYGMLLAEPALLLPVAYTPTVGEACQKFGLMPYYPRGCYVSLTDSGNVKEVLAEYAREYLEESEDGKFKCQCIVFSDGGRILGLGDLGAWGMGIPMGKLDLYTVCGGFDPYKTIPVIIDAGCLDANGNTAKLTIRDHPLYHGLKQDRVKHKSDAGTDVNTCYYGENSFIGEFMGAAKELFGDACILQFEDFNSNDAMPLLAEYRTKFLSYNDDIQGTASVAIAALLGSVKIQKPDCKDLVAELRKMKVLFHGAGSANLGGASLIIHEGGMPAEQVFVTNSKGLIWKSADGKEGTGKNEEQKALAQIGKPSYAQDLVSIIQNVKPDILIGAVGVAPNCFGKDVVEAMLAVQDAKPDAERLRPVFFALSNPKSQAEITAKDCYTFSKGRAIFGSGTRFDGEMVDGKMREPGQVNNFFVFPGMSFGALNCEATTIPEKFFMVAAEAVAHCLDEHDLDVESVVPHPGRIREVAMSVAAAVVLEAQKQGLAKVMLGDDEASVRKALQERMWNPKPKHRRRASSLSRTQSDFGMGQR